MVRGMKPRHAAALALVGWYLMLPPLATSGLDVDQNAPLSTWRQGGAFDTARACEVNRGDGIKRLDKANGEKQFPSFYHSFLYARCVAVDDPRLKGN
jgi:hypothetical protein